MESHLPPRALRIAALTGVAVLTAVSFATTAMTPTLATRHPALLVALDAPLRNILLARGVPVALLVALVVARRALGALVYFGVGRWYGNAAVRWLEGKLGASGRMVRMIERAFAAASVPMVFFMPVPLVCVLSGATRMRPWLFVSANVAGSIAIALLVRTLGNAFSRHVDMVLEFFQRNLVTATLAIAALLVLGFVVQRLRGRAPEVPRTEEDLPER